MGCNNSKPASTAGKQPEVVPTQAVEANKVQEKKPDVKEEAPKLVEETKADVESKDQKPVLALTSSNPKDVVANIAEELKKQAKECGIDQVTLICKTLENIKEETKKGPAVLFADVETQFTKLTSKLGEAVKNPSSLLDPNSPIATFAGWYTSEVATRLKDVAKEVDDTLVTARGHVKSATEPMGEVSAVLSKSLEGLSTTAEKLIALPNEMMALKDTVKGPADLAKVDMGPIKKVFGS